MFFRKLAHPHPYYYNEGPYRYPEEEDQASSFPLELVLQLACFSIVAGFIVYFRYLRPRNEEQQVERKALAV